jgi:ribosomal-protein-alanine N-acetyltransferase
VPHTLQTDRLLLRKAILRDAPALAALFGDRLVAANTKTWPHPVSREHALFRIRSWQATEGGSQCGFLMLHNGAVVGSLGLQHVAEGEWSLGYAVARHLWGQGLTPEAVRALCLFGFRTLGVERIAAEVFCHNAASLRVMDKCGFRRVGGVTPGWSTTLGAYFDCYRFALRRTDLKLG